MLFFQKVVKGRSDAAFLFHLISILSHQFFRIIADTSQL